MTNRVVITGIGGVSSIGMSVPEIYNSFREGKSGIGQLEFPDVTRLKVKTGGQIKNFNPSDHFELKLVGRMNRFSQFALLAANEALKTRGLEIVIKVGQKMQALFWVRQLVALKQ